MSKTNPDYSLLSHDTGHKLLVSRMGPYYSKLELYISY